MATISIALPPVICWCRRCSLRSTTMTRSKPRRSRCEPGRSQLRFGDADLAALSTFGQGQALLAMGESPVGWLGWTR